MSIKLKIILIIIMLTVLMYIFKSIKYNKISTKNALLWILANIFIVLCIIFIKPLLVIAHFIGIKTVANMMFFLGFIFLLILCFKQSTQLSILNKKIISLTQELGILQKEISNDKKYDVNKKI